ncbi:MAG TPA: hypothetical protein VFN56_03495 [Candidatus Saccharimonadales bacterium]|nr:hypothetical protein [Candidatus Saccharimonadales bacterium]
MGSKPNISALGIYSTLIGAFPAAYRRQYGQPMVQTFDDMLAAEPSALKKAIIWIRAVLDIPPQALKEHVTQQGVQDMSRSLKRIIAGIALVLLLANGASYWFGYLHARSAVGIVKVTPAQLADAMQHDEFYSTYGNAALLFTGTVTAGMQKNAVSLVTFQTDHTYTVQCQFSGLSAHRGEVLNVAAPGGSAERLAHGVLLHACTLND